MTQNISFQQVADLQHIKQPLAGGLTYIYYIPIEDVSSISDINPATGTIGNISLVMGKAWYRAFCPISNRSFTEQQEQGDGGPYMNMKVSGFLPFQSLDNRLTLATLKNRRFLVLLYTADDLIKMIGNKERGADFSFNSDSGKTYNEIPGCYFNFTWTHPDPAPVFDPSLGVNPGGGGGGGLPSS